MPPNLSVADIIRMRCANQRLGPVYLQNAEAVVRWQGAVQAQEYHPSLWGIGLRLGPGATKQSVVQELESGNIVRTWLMRGTIHYAPAKDAYWMARLLGPRINKKYVRYFEQAGLTPNDFAVGRRILIGFLQGGVQATRKELYAAFERAGIAEPSKRGRGSFVLQYWAQEGLVCMGPYRGKQQTFVLLAEWVPEPVQLTHDQALQTITSRYFASHGPATQQDFMFWSGLSAAEAKQGIALANDLLTNGTIDGKTYWTAATPDAPPSPPRCLLLPCFDEYAVAYKDRSAILDPAHREALGYGINTNIIVIDGRIAGSWQPPATPEALPVLHLTNETSADDREAIHRAAAAYSHFAFQ